MGQDVVGDGLATGGEGGRDAEVAMPERQSAVKVVTAAVLGTLVEYYDFAIYGFLATVLAANFFAETDQNTALLAAFATFGVAFIVRIPGGIFFGHIGDRYGRKRALSGTIVLMTVATTAIGLLPTYATWGIWATAMLVLCRCLQGFAAGGELGGANVFVAENAPWRRRGLETAIVNTGATMGLLAAAVLALGLTSVVTPEQLVDWAWRIAFLLSLVLGGIGIYIRRALEDTRQFVAIQQAATVSVQKVPIVTLLQTAWRTVLLVALMLSTLTGGLYMATIYGTSYLQTQGGHSPQIAFLSTCITLSVGIAIIPLAGHLSDRLGRRRPLIILSAVAAVAAGFPCFALMGSSSPGAAILGQVVLYATVSMVNGSMMAACSELLSARVRFSGLSFSINAANTVLGGTAPFIATLLITTTGWDLAPAGYFCFTATLTVVGALLIREPDIENLPL